MVRLIRRNGQATHSLKEVILEIENLFNGSVSRLIVPNRKKLRSVRSNGGAEYVCKRLGECFSERAIVPEIIRSYS